MTPTAFKVSQLAETARSNRAKEQEQHRANTLNFVSDIIGGVTDVATTGMSSVAKLAGSKDKSFSKKGRK